ncbi:beta-propeller fold lactonase family protein [Streptomyces sp. KM273126]|uniref:beta-propeller fold lactonase family protein n=1 Tax=Streptomyces sp. KM273126 TaxID=2545247 RepID=UPI00103FCCAD|nr:beta-propeller fold lactonase family protein [Streptomyces sp. KM273126]
MTSYAGSLGQRQPTTAAAVSRRAGIALPVAAVGAAHATSAVAAPAARRRRTVAYVGSRTTAAREGRGKGIEVYDVGPDGDTWTLLQTVELDNPTFLAADRTRRFLYAVHGDTIVAYDVDTADGGLRPAGGVVHTGSPVCVLFLQEDS